MNESSAKMLNAAGKPYGDLIRSYRKRKGLSQEQLGAIARVKKNAVGAWEAGRSRPDVASIPALCRELDMPLHVFFGLSDASGNDELHMRFDRLNAYNRQIILKQMDMLYELQVPHQVPVRKVLPLFRSDLSAAAGPVSYIEEARGETVYVAETPLTLQADEIIRVSGDSMEPTFYDGDLVLVRHSSRVQEGEIGIFVNGDAGYIKEYHRDGLYSHNAAYGVIRFSSEDVVRCIGKVLGKLQADLTATEEEVAAYLSGRMT